MMKEKQRGTTATSKRAKLQCFGTTYHRDIIDTMNKLGHGLKDVYEGLISNDKRITDVYKRLQQEQL